MTAIPNAIMIDVRKTMQLGDLLAAGRSGEEIVIADGEKPLARVVPITQPVGKKPRIAGLSPGSIWVSDDFDDPLPDEFWFGDETAS